jgi:hypothetical protein
MEGIEAGFRAKDAEDAKEEMRRSSNEFAVAQIVADEESPDEAIAPNFGNRRRGDSETEKGSANVWRDVQIDFKYSKSCIRSASEIAVPYS